MKKLILIVTALAMVGTFMPQLAVGDLLPVEPPSETANLNLKVTFDLSEAPGRPTGRVKIVDFVAEPTEGVAPLTVHFKSECEGEIKKYSWYFGDEDKPGRGPIDGMPYPIVESSNEQNPIHTYSKPGTYTVRLAVYGKHPGNEWERDEMVKTDYIIVYEPEPTEPQPGLEERIKQIRAELRDIAIDSIALYHRAKHNDLAVEEAIRALQGNREEVESLIEKLEQLKAEVERGGGELLRPILVLITNVQNKAERIHDMISKFIAELENMRPVISFTLSPDTWEIEGIKLGERRDQMFELRNTGTVPIDVDIGYVPILDLPVVDIEGRRPSSSVLRPGMEQGEDTYVTILGGDVVIPPDEKLYVGKLATPDDPACKRPLLLTFGAPTALSRPVEGLRVSYELRAYPVQLMVELLPYKLNLGELVQRIMTELQNLGIEVDEQQIRSVLQTLGIGPEYGRP